MNRDIDPVFATALREAVVEQAAGRQAASWRPHRRSWWIGGLTVAALGATGAAVALVGLPGEEVETRLSETQVESGDGPGEVQLGATPATADAVQFEFTCFSPGAFTIGTSGVFIRCTQDDVGTMQTWGLVPLSSLDDGALSVDANAGEQWQLEAWYVETDRVPLAVNDNGETYGVDSAETPPDLIRAQATNGEVGYVRRSELDAGAGPLPTSPAEAAVYEPEPYSVPVYEHDGVTVIGEFDVE